MSDAAKPEDVAAIDRDLQDILRDQKERQDRLRHVQEFMSTPVFMDLAELSVDVTDDADALDERRRELDYRIDVLSSVLELLREERGAMDRVRAAGDAQAAADATRRSDIAEDIPPRPGASRNKA